MRYLLGTFIFPLGRLERQPGDRLGHKVSQLLMSPSETRSRLTNGMFISADVNDPVGLLEAAHKGTIFLDEIGDLPLETQPKLLRVLESKEFERIGSVNLISSDFRIIAATNQDLEGLMKTGQFRRDLYYRLRVVVVQVPPLRDRRGDIPLLARHFLELYGERFGRPGLALSREALAALMVHQFPGNVRELENIVERGLARKQKLEEEIAKIEMEATPPGVTIAAGGDLAGHSLLIHGQVSDFEIDIDPLRGNTFRPQAGRFASEVEMQTDQLLVEPLPGGFTLQSMTFEPGFMNHRIEPGLQRLIVVRDVQFSGSIEAG